MKRVQQQTVHPLKLKYEITNDYDYDVSGFAGTTVVTNPYNKDVEYYSLLAGMYDKDGKLIGVMDSMDNNRINSNQNHVPQHLGCQIQE